MALKNAIGNKPLTVPEGGTGQSTLTQNGILVGNGTAAISSIAGTTNGQVFIAATGLPPQWQPIISSDGSVTVTPGANTVTLSAAAVGTVQAWTPTITFTPAKAFTYNNRVASYIQVGNLIYWEFNVRITGNTFPSTMTISGLPGNYDLSIPRYYFPMNGNIVFSPNAQPWPQGFCYLDTATGLINLMTNQPSANNALWTEKVNASSLKQFFASGFYFTN